MVEEREKGRKNFFLEAKEEDVVLFLHEDDFVFTFSSLPSRPYNSKMPSVISTNFQNYANKRWQLKKIFFFFFFFFWGFWNIPNMSHVIKTN